MIIKVPVSVLTRHYPKWRANCLESARWLRSGKEYEDWHISRGLTPIPVAERERRALEYEAKAAGYLNLIGDTMRYRVNNLGPTYYLANATQDKPPGSGIMFSGTAPLPEQAYWVSAYNTSPIPDGTQIDVELKMTIGTGTLYYHDIPSGDKGSFTDAAPVTRKMTHVGGAEGDPQNHLLIRGTGPY